MTRPYAFTAQRKGDWEAALAAWIAECEGKPHAYGEHDCLLFPSGAALAMTGEDPAAEVRGRYCTKAGAARALLADGEAKGHTGTLEAAIDARFEAVPTSFARRGDWALHEGAIGVVVGRFALFVGAAIDDAGELERACWVRVPRAAWEKAWSV